VNSEENFRAALRESGIEYSGPIYIDGKLHRFKAEGDHARNSWYVLHAGPPAAGAFGCWKRDLKETWCERNGSLTQQEGQSVRQRWREASAKLRAEIVVRQEKARKVAAWILNRSRPALTLHRYLFQKRVKVLGNLRWYRRSLVLPLRDLSGELQSLQFIGGDGAKNFLRGGRIAGCFFTLAYKTDGPLVICEGFATGASIHEATGHAVFCAMNSGNLLEVAKAARERWPQREIIIAADNDQFTDGNPGLTKATATAKAIRAKVAVPQFKDLAGEPTDFNDLATAEGLDGVKEKVGSAQVPRGNDTKNWPQMGDVTDDEAIARLAALPLLEYERRRKDEADRLLCRESVLDKLVEARRPKNCENNGLQGNVVQLRDVEPWPEEVNGAEILDAISHRFEHYVVLPQGAADMLSLWCAHTYTYKVFQVSPRVHASSPTHNCGKSTLRDCASLFCQRAVRTDNMSTAVMFRLVSGQSPTVLADECDKWIFPNEELLGLICSGHRKGGDVMRCEGDENELRKFRCHAPIFLAAIGTLPAQVHSRSIVVRLERATREEFKACARFDLEHVEVENELCRKLARWVADNRERIAACEPKLPENLFNRMADNWRPLFKIAEVAGGNWPQRCANALIKLTAEEDEAESLRVMLLADIRQVLTAEKIFSRDLRDLLADMDERPWPEVCRGGKPITERWLARNLAAFGIKSKNVRIDEKQAKGYERTDFDDVFAHYLEHARDVGTDTERPNNDTGTDTETEASPRKNDEWDAGTAEKPKNAPCNEFFPGGTSTL
jgi:putative DNA primase/helicase